MNGSLDTFLDSLYREGPYEIDRPLMEELGLKTVWHGRHEHVDLGTIVVEEAEERDGVTRPAAEIKVEVCAMPAQFWRFTILRPRDDSGSYEPREKIVVSTGSGNFTQYWPGARHIAENCFEVEHKGDES